MVSVLSIIVNVPFCDGIVLSFVVVEVVVDDVELTDRDALHADMTVVDARLPPEPPTFIRYSE
jgi:hypothetical protein